MGSIPRSVHGCWFLRKSWWHCPTATFISMVKVSRRMSVVFAFARALADGWGHADSVGARDTTRRCGAGPRTPWASRSSAAAAARRTTKSWNDKSRTSGVVEKDSGRERHVRPDEGGRRSSGPIGADRQHPPRSRLGIRARRGSWRKRSFSDLSDCRSARRHCRDLRLKDEIDRSRTVCSKYRAPRAQCRLTFSIDRRSPVSPTAPDAQGVSSPL